MKVVIDTVVFVRSLIGPHSWWGRLIFAYAGHYDLVVSPPIVAEYEEITIVTARAFLRILEDVGSHQG